MNNTLFHYTGDDIIYTAAVITALTVVFYFVRKSVRNVRRMARRTNTLLDGFLGVDADADLGIEARPGVLERLANVEKDHKEVHELVTKELQINGGGTIKDKANQAVLINEETQELVKSHILKAEQSERDLDFLYTHLGLIRGKTQQELPFEPPQGGQKSE